MRRTLVALMVTVALPAALLIAQQKSSEIDLQAAMRTEIVDGDLQSAITQYANVVSKHKNDRAVAATALVRMAECYQKLGDAQSRAIYQRVMREYSDQPKAVALARARLGQTQTDRAAGDRAVWTGRDVDMFGRVSPDGRWLTYVDWNNTGNLMVRDLESGVSRAITQKKSYSEPGGAGYSSISPDGKQIAYAWDDWAGNISVRLTPLHAEASPPVRELFSVSEKEVRFITVRDWSPDGKWIATAFSRSDGTGQITILSTENGAVQVLKSVGWSTPERIFFSRDSKYIAYDLPASDEAGQHDVFVLAIDGSREIPAVVHTARDEVVGWSADGRQLLFSSDRTGSNGLWALSFANGEVKGAPELLKADIGDTFSLGLTNAGALYVCKGVSSRDVKIAPIDLAAGKLAGPVVDFQGGFLSRPRTPAWSPDGKFLAYAACGGNCLVIRSLETREVKELPRTLLYYREPRWSPDGRSVVTAARDNKGRNGVFQIDVRSGAVTRLVDGAPFGASPQWSPDGTKLFYSKRGEGYFERDVSTQADRLIFQRPRLYDEISLSPDGQWLAARVGDPSTKSTALLLVPVGGAEPRELLRLTPTENFGGMRTIGWTPDGRALLVTRRRDSGSELLLVPTNGEPVRRLDIDPNMWIRGGEGFLDSGFSLSPDGRYIAFLMGKSASEVWAIENFLTQN